MAYSSWRFMRLENTLSGNTVILFDSMDLWIKKKMVVQLPTTLTFFLLSWNILLLLFTKQLWCCQYMYKFPLHVSLGSVCMEGGRSQYQENPRGWDNFSLGLHAEILVRVVPRQGTLIHRNSQRRIEIHQSQTMKFWTCWSKLLFLKRNAKMIDGSEETQTQVGFWTSEFACLWKA